MTQATEKQINFINTLIEKERNISAPTGFSAASMMDIYTYEKRFWAAVEVNVESLTSENASDIINWLKSNDTTRRFEGAVRRFIGETAYAMIIIRISAKHASIANEILDALGNRLVEFVASIAVPENRKFWILSINELRDAVEKFTTQPESTDIENQSAERELQSIMTASEVDEVYGLGEGTARQACNRGQIRCRKSGPTWLIRRADADAVETWAEKKARKDEAGAVLYINHSEYYGNCYIAPAKSFTEMDKEFGGDADWTSDPSIYLFDVDFVESYYKDQRTPVTREQAQMIFDEAMRRYNAGDTEAFCGRKTTEALYDQFVEDED